MYSFFSSFLTSSLSFHFHNILLNIGFLFFILTYSLSCSVGQKKIISFHLKGNSVFVFEFSHQGRSQICTTRRKCAEFLRYNITDIFSNFLQHIKNSEDIIHAWLDLKWNDIQQTKDIYLHYVLSLFKYSFADRNIKWNNKCDLQPAVVFLIQQRNTIVRALWTLFLIKMWKNMNQNMDYNFLPLTKHKKGLNEFTLFSICDFPLPGERQQYFLAPFSTSFIMKMIAWGNANATRAFSFRQCFIFHCSCTFHYCFGEQTGCWRNCYFKPDIPLLTLRWLAWRQRTD